VSDSPDVAGFRSRFAREKIVLPIGSAAGGALAAWLLSRSDLYGGLVIPTTDEVIAELNAHRRELSAHYRLVLPPHRACEVALDKALHARVSRDCDIPAPRTIEHPESLSAAELSNAAGLGFPAIVKPCGGDDFQRAFSRKLDVVNSPDELRRVLDSCRERGLPVVLQERLPVGAPAGAYSAYVSRSGKIIGDYASRRLALLPPHYGVGFYEVSEDIPQIVDSSRRFLEAVGYAGAPANIDFVLDPRDGQWKLLDLNARSWRQVSLAPLVGLDVFEMLLADYEDRPLPSPKRIRYGRHWLYIRDALMLARAWPDESLGPLDYLSIFKAPFKVGLFDWIDIRPFIADLAPLVTRRFRRGKS
jgi:predicted ATP-grasp superfamily ATP-dependent carboligase